MESKENSSEYLSINQFLDGCSFSFRYNHAGAKPEGGRGRGKFQTTLEKMRNQKEWEGHYKDAEYGNVILYTKKMLDAAKRAVENE